MCALSRWEGDNVLKVKRRSNVTDVVSSSDGKCITKLLKRLNFSLAVHVHTHYVLYNTKILKRRYI